MIIATVKIIPIKGKRQEILDILSSVKGPLLAEPGCLASCIYEEHGEAQSLIYVEHWRSLAELERHVRSSSYVRILETMELSFTIPEVYFYDIGETWGLELVERLRSPNQQNVCCHSA
jgi:quinol monooxygenase YgiN